MSLRKQVTHVCMQPSHACLCKHVKPHTLSVFSLCKHITHVCGRVWVMALSVEGVSHWLSHGPICRSECGICDTRHVRISLASRMCPYVSRLSRVSVSLSPLTCRRISLSLPYLYLSHLSHVMFLSALQCEPVPIYVYICIYIYSYIYIRIHIYIHTYIHTCINTYILNKHIYMCVRIYL